MATQVRPPPPPHMGGLGIWGFLGSPSTTNQEVSFLGVAIGARPLTRFFSGWEGSEPY